MNDNQTPAANADNDEAEKFEPFELAADSYTFDITDRKRNYSLTVRAPKREEDERRERMSSTIKRTAKKVEGQNAVTVVTDNSKAQIQFIKTLALTAKGYALRKDDSPDTVLDCQEVFDNSDPENPKRIIDLIDKHAGHHLVFVSNQLYGGTIKPLRRDNEVLTLTVERENVMRQEIGKQMLEDGSFSKARHRIDWEFAEASAERLLWFENFGFTGTTVFLDGGGTEEHRRASLDRFEKLFDEHIRGIARQKDGSLAATINGEEFNRENPAHLKKINIGLKKTLWLLYANSLQIEAGN